MHEISDPEGQPEQKRRALSEDDQIRLDLYATLIISQMRTYDVLLTILQLSGEEGYAAADSLLQLHEQGKFRFPPPSIRKDNNE